MPSRWRSRRRYAELTGYDGGDEGWPLLYSELCQEYGWQSGAGVTREQFAASRPDLHQLGMDGWGGGGVLGLRVAGLANWEPSYWGSIAGGYGLDGVDRGDRGVLKVVVMPYYI